MSAGSVSSSISSTSSSFQRGFAKVIAEKVNNHTRLTQVSHQAPTRLLPLTGSSLLEASGKAQCALSNYGGGMVHGDESIVTLHVKEGASLGITTQGPNRIYKRKFIIPSQLETIPKTCKTRIQATVENHGFLVLAPDPTVLFARSHYEQITELRLFGNKSSCIAVDWFAAGRVQNGEEWSLDSFSTTTELYQYTQDSTDSKNAPILVDRIRLPSKSDSMYSCNFWGTQALCSIILAGPQSLPVVRNLQAWSKQLTAQVTRVRNLETSYHDTKELDDDVMTLTTTNQGINTTIPIKSLGKNVIVSVSEVNADQLYVARIAAQSNEDIYRVLMNSFSALDFGVPFYKDRVSSSATLSPSTHATTSIDNQIKRMVTTTSSTPSLSTRPMPFKDDSQVGVNSAVANNFDTEKVVSPNRNGHNQMMDQTLWSALIMMDSCLPTGSFAHSAGLEVAQQFGFLADDDHVEAIIVAATHSALQLATPYMLAGLKQSMTSYHADEFTTAWQTLDQSLHALMASNSPACQASMDQGQGLLRVALAWSQKQQAKNNNDDNRNDTYSKLRCIQSSITRGHHGHLAPLFGIVIHALLGITSPELARQMLAYTMARDMISAAVRLNAIGPLASIGILDQVYKKSVQQFEGTPRCCPMSMSLADASSSTPVLDVLHPCHDLLAVRLFRT